MSEPRHTLHTQAITAGDDVVALRRNKLRLVVERGPDKKRKVELAADRVLIGTHERCDLVLTDATVSRQHCEIAVAPGGYAVRDLGSTNGTWIGDVRVLDAIIDRKTVLRLGDSHVRVVPTDDAVEIALPREVRFGQLLGKSAAMRRVFEVLARVAGSDATVLLEGESGTGKELAARAIHDASARAGGPFVVVDCGAIPEGLVESELFGHKKGSFTGAVSDRVGAFEAASGGTVFLDELGELPLAMQTRLLGALERRVVQPVGSSESVAVDVRVVAATNRDLRREINRGTFREDLYFRLAVVTVAMPALRERPEDIPLYIEAFAADYPGVTISPEVIESLRGKRWPGNVRELRNALERAAALGEVSGGDGGGGALPAVGGEVDPSVPFKVGKAALIEAYERAYCERLMAAHDDNITQAARSAGIDRVYLLRLLDKYGMRPGRRR